MKRSVRMISLGAFLLWGLPVFAGRPQSSPVQIEGDEVTYKADSKNAEARGNVKITQGDTALYCDEAFYDAAAGKVYLSGRAKIVKTAEGESVFTGDSAVYDLNLERASMKDVDMKAPPLYGRSIDGVRANDTYYLNRGYVTTCDRAHPHYTMTAKKMEISPGRYFKAWRVFFKVGPVPLAYIPYYYQRLDESFPCQISLGRSKYLGGYILTRWRERWLGDNHTYLNFDRYESRGWGFGLAQQVASRSFGTLSARGYYIDDKLYLPQKRITFLDYYPQRYPLTQAPLSEKYFDHNRYKAQFFYNNWRLFQSASLKAEVNKFSDTSVLEDFFQRERDNFSSTVTYALLDYAPQALSLSLLGTKVVNRYEGGTEKLPQLGLNVYPRAIGDSSIYFGSQSFAYGLYSRAPYTKRVAYSTNRFSTYNFVEYPFRAGWLMIKPNAGQYAFYDDRSVSQGGLWNTVGSAGISLSSNFYKTMSGDFNVFGRQVKSMRHIISPVLSYNYVPDPTAPIAKFRDFGTAFFPPPANLATFALDNKLKGKTAADEKWDLIYFSPAINYVFNDPVRGDYFSTATGLLEVIPRSGIRFKGDTTYDIPRRRLSGANAEVAFYQANCAEDAGDSLIYQHSFQRGNSTQGLLTLLYDLTSKLRFNNYTRYRYDTGDMLEQEYGLRVDLHCWWFSLNFNLKPTTTVKRRDATFWFEFTLKAFPDKARLGYSHSYNNVYRRVYGPGSGAVVTN